MLSHLIVPKTEDISMELGTQVGLTFLFLVLETTVRGGLFICLFDTALQILSYRRGCCVFAAVFVVYQAPDSHYPSKI